MGVDASIKIRLYLDDKKAYKDIQVSDQANALGDVFYNKTLGYTSIQFDRETELSSEESSLIELFPNEENEMQMQSTILDATHSASIFDKISRTLYQRKIDSLNSDLKKIDLIEISDEDKYKRKHNLIGEYIGFEMSFSTMNGILKTAKELNYKIQIIVEFY